MLFDEKLPLKNIAFTTSVFGCVQCWWNFSKVFEDLQIVVFYFCEIQNSRFSCFFHLQLFIWPCLSKNVSFCDVLWSHWHIRYVNLLLLFEDLFEMCVNVFLWDERSESQPRMGLQRLLVPISIVIEELCVKCKFGHYINSIPLTLSGLIFGHFFDKSSQLELAVFEFFWDFAWVFFNI